MFLAKGSAGDQMHGMNLSEQEGQQTVAEAQVRPTLEIVMLESLERGS
jgi:hypothetical protein